MLLQFFTLVACWITASKWAKSPRFTVWSLSSLVTVGFWTTWIGIKDQRPKIALTSSMVNRTPVSSMPDEFSAMTETVEECACTLVSTWWERNVTRDCIYSLHLFPWEFGRKVKNHGHFYERLHTFFAFVPNCVWKEKYHDGDMSTISRVSCIGCRGSTHSESGVIVGQRFCHCALERFSHLKTTLKPEFQKKEGKPRIAIRIGEQ